MQRQDNASNILNILDGLSVSECSFDEWLKIGMALKEEGCPVEAWDKWSRDDKRYHAGECEKRWDSFGGSSTPVTGGTIIQIARDHGVSPSRGYDEDSAYLDFDDYIEYDGPERFDDSPSTWSASDDLIKYLETLFNPEEHVGYVIDSYQREDGKWMPANAGMSDRTAEELIKSLRRYPDGDVGATVGDWNPEAGAWIRFNPLDGTGAKDKNVTSFRYALVESDSMPTDAQYELYKKLELPIAALVHSAGKSLHAIVHIDAVDEKEYAERVSFLYDYLEKNGLECDKADKNPSRLSRMPGITRGSKRQYLIATNIGKPSWSKWIANIDGAPATLQNLPPIITLRKYIENPPILAEELIEGILRRGHKMLISGSSKAGKSFLLMELCIAIAEGRKWLGFQCKKGKVLYVNLEIDPESAGDRFLKIYKALKLEPVNCDNIEILNLRGRAVTLDKLTPQLIDAVNGHNLDAIIIDPIYKVITGDENNASDMGAFCNNFDKICTEVGCSVIYCHHHSKGAQGGKNAMDRASGSGVFARDPDAQLDMIELVMDDDFKNLIGDKQTDTAWRMESSLREFANIKPVNFWFRYPVHELDNSGELEKLSPQVSAGSGGSTSRKTENNLPDKTMTAFEVLLGGSTDGTVSVQEMADYLSIERSSVYPRISKCPELMISSGRISRVNPQGKS